jgi:ribosomal protein S18 acetylase RimI-like enzyme
MSNVRYVTMSDETFLTDVVGMMEALYLEDEPAPHVDPAKFPDTIRHLLAHPEAGRLTLFLEEQALSGYAILIPHWSNEYGGIVVLLDELYVRPSARQKGLAGGFLEKLKCERPWAATAVFLEVSRHNQRAQRLYESAGFREGRNRLMVLPF